MNVRAARYGAERLRTRFGLFATSPRPFARSFAHTSTKTKITHVPLKNRSVGFPTTTIRPLSVSTSSDSNPEDDDREQIVLYEGPFSTILGHLKRVSVFSCVMSCVSLPLLTYTGNPLMSMGQRVVVGSVVTFFAVSTTAALYFIAKPYVVEISTLIRLPESEDDEIPDLVDPLKMDDLELQVTTLDYFARPKQHYFTLNDILKPGDRPWATFTTKQGGVYYLHDEDAEQWISQDLFDRFLSKLHAASEPKE